MIQSSQIQSILHNHPNQVREIPVIPPDEEFQSFVEEHSLDRTPITLDDDSEVWKKKLRGVGMKKAHEITRLATYIHSLPSHISRDYVVDVGSGQGYLHRVLSAKKILALDSDEHQIVGAEAREKKNEKEKKGVDSDVAAEVTHKALDITPESLIAAIDDWVSSFRDERRVTVLLVALHACGSLHIDALRAFITASHDNARRRWYFSGAVTVPCCYNLMRPLDFPISLNGPSLLEESGLPHPLPASAYHLAAQGELESRNPEKWELGNRKVIWRALVGPILEDLATSKSSTPQTSIASKEFIVPSEFHSYKNANAPTPRRNLQTIAAPTFSTVSSMLSDEADVVSETSGTGTSVLFQRLGKLPNAAYVSWEVFMQHVENRLYPGYHSTAEAKDLDARLPRTHPLYVDSPSNPPLSIRARNLQQLHLARCSLGPVVESVILKDRRQWAEEQLQQLSSKQWEVLIVPLFDQKLGSARNMTVVIVPKSPKFVESREG